MAQSDQLFPDSVSNYGHNTSQCLERSHDYRLTMIEGSKHGTII